MENHPASEVEQDIQRAIINAELQLNGVGVGTREQRNAVARAQMARNKTNMDAICRQARDVLQARPPRPMLAFCIKQSLRFPGLLEQIGTV